MGKELGLFPTKGEEVEKFGYLRLGKYFLFCAQKSRLTLELFLPLETYFSLYTFENIGENSKRTVTENRPGMA